MECPRCGSDIDPSAKYCKMCGITFVPGRHTPVQRTAMAAQPPMYRTDQGDGETDADVTFDLESMPAELSSQPLHGKDSPLSPNDFSFTADEENFPDQRDAVPAGDDLNWFNAEGFSPLYAGFWRRFVAFFIDGLILSIMATVAFGAIFANTIAQLQQMAMVGDKPDPELLKIMLPGFIAKLLFFLVFYFVVDWLYNAILTSSSRQATLGKMAVGVIVTDLNGERISFLRATGRYVVRLFISGFLLIGYLIQLFTGRRQALHDLIAATLVIRR